MAQIIKIMNSLTYFIVLLQIIHRARAFHLPARSHAIPHVRLQSATVSSHSSCRGNTALHVSSENNIPSEKEIAQQKAETYQALSSFHETRMDGDDEDNANIAEYWECKDGAISFPVPMDPAAGLKKGTVSKPYKSSVQIQMNINRSPRGDLQRQGLRLVENIQFGDNADDTVSMPFVRSIPLDHNADVDTDGTYSLDISTSGDVHLPLLPSSMMAGLNPSSVKFLVEHTIAISDTERSRCFFVYGDADRDGGAREDQEFDDEVNEEDEDLDEDQADDRVNRNYRLMGVVFADENKKLPAETEIESPLDFSSLLNKEQPTSSQSPLDLLQLNANDVNKMSDQDKMDALYKAIGKHNERVMSNSGGTNQSEEDKAAPMVRYTPTLYNICSGVYLGDTFVREPLKVTSKAQSRGFGNLKSRRSEEQNQDDFATWAPGVQKTSVRFQWDYSSSIIQDCQYGKYLGAMNQLKCNAMSRSVGTIVVDQGRVTKPREERRTIWYMDGAYLAGLIGSNYFRVSTLHCICCLCDACKNSSFVCNRKTRHRDTCPFQNAMSMELNLD